MLWYYRGLYMNRNLNMSYRLMTGCKAHLSGDYLPPAEHNSILPYRSSVKVFAGRVWETGFFQKAGFPQNPFMQFAGHAASSSPPASTTIPITVSARLPQKATAQLCEVCVVPSGLCSFHSSRYGRG